MHEDVQVAPFFLDQVGGGLDLGVVADVALEGEFPAEFLAQGLHTLFDGLAHIVEGQPGPLGFET